MRQRLVVLLINAALFFGLLGLIEFGARAVQVRRLGEKALVPPARIDRWTGWRLTPGYARPDVEHNNQGFRHSKEVSLEKAANTVRIFFMGGSAAYGCEGLYPRSMDPDWQKIYNRELIDAYLQQKLQERHPERNWEVINAAVNEYRMHQSFIELYSRLLPYHPDLVVFMDGHNDISGLSGGKTDPYDAFADTPHAEEFDSLVQPKSLRSLFYINSTWLRSNSVFFDVLYRKTLAQVEDPGFGQGADPRPVTSPVQWSDLSPSEQTQAAKRLALTGYYRHMAERLFHGLEYEGVATVFSLQPELITSPKPLTPAEVRFADYTRKLGGRQQTYLWEQMRSRIAADMTASAAENHYPFVDLGDTFREVNEKAFTDYCHLTPKGNERIAERLYQTIASTQLPKLLEKTAPSY